MGILRDAKNWEHTLKNLALSSWRLYDHCMIWELGIWVSPVFFFGPQPYDRDWYGDQHGADATCNNHQPSATQNHNPCWYSWSDSDYQLFHHARDLNSWLQERLWLRILLHLGSRWSCRPVETTISRCQGLLRCSLTRETGTILFFVDPQDIPVASSRNNSVWDPGNLKGSPYWMAPIGRTKPCHRMLTRKIFSRPTEPYI